MAFTIYLYDGIVVRTEPKQTIGPQKNRIQVLRQDYNAGILNEAAGAVRYRPASTNHNSPDEVTVDIDRTYISILFTHEKANPSGFVFFTAFSPPARYWPRFLQE